MLCQVLGTAPTQIVNNADAKATLEQTVYCVAANEPGTSGDDYDWLLSHASAGGPHTPAWLYTLRNAGATADIRHRQVEKNDRRNM